MDANELPPVPAGAHFQVFFDGECPLCMREIRMLRRRDTHSRIAFTDIADADFSAAQYDKTQSEFMGAIHGRDVDGAWHSGVDVFRHLYTAIGFGRLVSMTRWPGVRQGLELGYRLFARYRLAMTGRVACETDRCAMPGIETKTKTA